MVAQNTQISIPIDLAERLAESAKKMGLDIPAYLVYLEKVHAGQISARAQEAAKFLFSKHGESLRKLAQ